MKSSANPGFVTAFMENTSVSGTMATKNGRSLVDRIGNLYVIPLFMVGDRNTYRVSAEMDWR